MRGVDEGKWRIPLLYKFHKEFPANPTDFEPMCSHLWFSLTHKSSR